MSLQARHNFGIVEIDGMLYILGGEDGDRELISMECYDIYSKTWTKQPDLTMVRKVSASISSAGFFPSWLQSQRLFLGLVVAVGRLPPRASLTRHPSAERSPPWHTSASPKCALEDAQRIQALEVCLCWQLASFMSAVTQHSRKEPVSVCLALSSSAVLSGEDTL